MSQEQQQDGAGLQQQQPRPGKVQLGEFWLQAPNAWFAAAELKLEVAHITSEREHFAHAVGAMGFSVLRAVLDLVENPPATEPYTMLKGPWQCGGSGSVESVSFPWIGTWICIKKWLDPESRSGSVSNDMDPDPTKTIENIK